MSCHRDEDDDGTYDDGGDPPQPGIEIVVTDPAGASIRGITDDDGRFVLTGTDQLTGGRYQVVAAIPPNLSELVPVDDSLTFASFETTVDLRGGSETVRMGVAPKPVIMAVSPAPEPSVAPPPAGSRPPRFAVGDTVWQDLNRSGRQEPGEPPAVRISVQLLNVDGDVVESTVSSATGHYVFDDLAGGTYAVRFAGVPSEFRLTTADAGDNPATDSDPDYTGSTPPFTLGVEAPRVREATAADGVSATYINADIDAGITPLRYAIGDRVWLDSNADGAQQASEPPAAAEVSLLRDEPGGGVHEDRPQGLFRFTGLAAGSYRLHFELGEHRRFTARNAASDPVLDSDVDPRTGTTSVITVGPGAADLMSAGDLGVADADLVNATVSAGLVGAYAVGDMVWSDDNGNGLLDPGETGLSGVRVELLDQARRVLDRAVTSGSGHFTFADLPAGELSPALPPAGQGPGLHQCLDRDQPGGRLRCRRRRADRYGDARRGQPGRHHGGRRPDQSGQPDGLAGAGRRDAGAGRHPALDHRRGSPIHPHRGPGPGRQRTELPVRGPPADAVLSRGCPGSRLRQSSRSWAGSAPPALPCRRPRSG